MGCRKAWELMMKRLDGKIDRRDSMILENHLRICPDCRRQEASLHALLRELERSRPVAPVSIEKKVMQKICAEDKNTAPLLPYVVLPSAVLAGMLAFMVRGMYTAGPMSLVDKASRALAMLYKMYESAVAVSRVMFVMPFAGEMLAATGILFFACVMALVLKQWRRKSGKTTGGR